MTTTRPETKAFRLSRKLSVEITVIPGNPPGRPGVLKTTWTPRRPSEMTEAEVQAYRGARDAMYARLAVLEGCTQRPTNRE